MLGRARIVSLAEAMELLRDNMPAAVVDEETLEQAIRFSLQAYDLANEY